MATVEQPITRSELWEEISFLLQHYATKADLQAVKADLYKAMIQLGLFITGVVG